MDTPARTLRPLSDYTISPQTGFVPDPDPLVEMPDPFSAVEALVQDLPSLIRSRRLRDAIRTMAEVDVSLADTPAARERLFLALTMLTNAWVWGDREPDLVLPATLARPVCALGRTLDRPPVVSHASMCLWNWRRLDPSQPVSTDNTELLVRFLGGVDETWFSTATLGVELAGGALMGTLHEVVMAAVDGEEEVLEAGMMALAERMPTLSTALARMREWCDPDIFYRRLRPFLGSWPAPGLVYTGVSEDPVVLAGGSAAQSTLIQAFDAALGVPHRGSTAGFLRAMRAHMPIDHRRFLVDVEAVSHVRDAATTGSPGLRSAYDVVLGELDLFRRRHMALAVEYVVKPSGESVALGTGGTEFTGFLREAREDTAGARLG